MSALGALLVDFMTIQHGPRGAKQRGHVQCVAAVARRKNALKRLDTGEYLRCQIHNP